MIRSILVPLDGSSFGEHALPLAAGLARRADARLNLVHVHQVLPPTTVAGMAVMDSVELHLRQDEQAYLADVARRLTEVGPVNVKTLLVDGEVEPALREAAARTEADLVVMSTHGRGALGRFWLGSVTNDLVRDLPRPVLVVRPEEDGKADLKRNPDLSHILIPLDGTPLAEQVIEPAIRLGELFNARYTLLRVIQPALRASYLPDGATGAVVSAALLEEVQSMQKSWHDEAMNYLEGVAGRFEQRGLSAKSRVVVEEQPAAGILHEALTHGVKLIAVETHARSGFSRLFLGSVAEKVVRGGVFPVLLNRPTQ